MDIVETGERCAAVISTSSVFDRGVVENLVSQSTGGHVLAGETPVPTAPTDG